MMLLEEFFSFMLIRFATAVIVSSPIMHIQEVEQRCCLLDSNKMQL